MLTISNNPTRKGLSVFRPNVIYSTASGVELTMDMLIPQRADTDPSRNPVIVFIQGSAWHFPDTTYEIPQLARFSAADTQLLLYDTAILITAIQHPPSCRM